MIPEFKVEAAFGSYWYTDPDTAVWTNITSYVRLEASPMKWRRGRSNSQQRTPQEAQLDLVWDCRDDASLLPDNEDSPHYPYVDLGLPIRVWMADSTGTLQRAFLGFVVKMDPSHVGQDRDWQQVSVTAIDILAWINAAGDLRTFKDRVLIDFAGGRTLKWLLGDGTGLEVVQVTAAVPTDMTSPDPATQFGLSVVELSDAASANSAGYPWSGPLCGGVVLESTSDGDQGAIVNTSSGFGLGATAGWLSDRPGGMYTTNEDSSGLTVTVEANYVGIYSGDGPGANWSRQQWFVGRPPAQRLAPALYDPANASSWTISGGSKSRVAASSLAWVPKRLSWDPTTGATAIVVEGPDGAIRVSNLPNAGTITLTANRPAVTAGEWVAATLLPKATTAPSNVTVVWRWFNGSGVQVGADVLMPINAVPEGSGTLGNGGIARVVMQVPAGAVSGAYVVTNLGATATFELYAPGFYTAEITGQTLSGQPVRVCPGRWWPAGASDQMTLFGQWRIYDPSIYGLGTATDKKWVHVEIPVDWAADGTKHQITWNVDPGYDDGTGLRPLVCVDGVEVPAASQTWRVSTPCDASSWIDSAGGSGDVPGFGGPTVGAGVPSVPGYQPSTLVNWLTVSGLSRVPVLGGQTPTPELAARWFNEYGDPAASRDSSLPDAAAPSTTSEVFANFLDSIGVPESLRDIDACTTPATFTWTDTPVGSSSAQLGTAQQLLTTLTTGEYGYVGTDAAGRVVFRRRRWYDADGDGTTLAKYHLVPDAATATRSIDVVYLLPLQQSKDDDNLTNRVLAQVSEDATTSAFAEDTASIRALLVRAQTLTYAQWSQEDCDAVVAEAIALYGRPRLRVLKAKLLANRVDDPMLDVFHDLEPSDVVSTLVPRGPAADKELGGIVQLLDFTVTPTRATCDVTLGGCPVTVHVPNPALYPSEDLFPAEDLYPAGA